VTGPFTDTGVIVGITRLGYTRLGNPRFEVALDNGQWYRTKANGNAAQDLDNKEYLEGVTVELALTRRFEIDSIKVV